MNQDSVQAFVRSLPASRIQGESRVVAVDRCPVCHGAGLRPAKFYTWYLNVGEPFGVAECGHCGHLFLSPRPGPDLVGTLYRTGVLEGYPEYVLESYTRRLKDSFVEMGYVRDIRTLQTRLARGANILEIGCSSGEFMALAVRAGHAACGVEADPDACAKARAAGLNVFCGTIEEYAPVGQYDAVYSSHVIEHLESPVLVAGKIFDLLKPGGWLLAEVPNQLANAYVRRDRWLRRLPQRVRSGWSIHHLHFFSPATFRRLFADRGFEITWVKTFDQNPVSLLRRAIRWTTRLTFGGGATLIQVLARRPA